MAATPKPFNLANIDAALVTVYTCPASTIALVHNLMVTNVLGTDTTVDVTYTQNATGVTTYLIKGATLVAGGCLIILGDNQKQAMAAADIIQVKGGAVNSVDCTGAVLEVPA
jgi:hypothetical protein